MGEMSDILWTWSARNDLRAIHDYIARDSGVYARRMINRIGRSVQRLRRFPESGWRVPEWERDDLREILVGNYRVIYQPAADVVRILAVVHAARQLPNDLADS